MIPIRDTVQSRNYPVVNMSLIGLNVLVFFYQMGMSTDMDKFVYVYGLVPARYTVDYFSHYFSFWQQALSFVSYMFLHGGFLHLLGNMWFLYIFGDNVEDHLGSSRYLLFYLACGLTAGVTHLMLNLNSNTPTIGASGAIAGVMGAYFLLYPRAKILTLIPIIIIPWFLEIPAFFFLGFWFLMQFLNAAGSHGATGGVAWWAHVGGFVFGMVLLKLIEHLPSLGISRNVRRMTRKKGTHRLQVIRPSSPGRELHLYGTINVSPYESFTGTQKLINIPHGIHKKMVRVTVPSGVNQGTQLRLKGLGRPGPDGTHGDLLLKVNILSPRSHG